MTTEEFLAQFSRIWKGGYFEGDPLDPLSKSSYGPAGYTSVLYTTYLACIRPYVNETTTCIEIGPGRGAWTKAILARNPRKVYVLDVVPPDHTGFWQYVGDSDRVTYLTVKDFSMDDVPDHSGQFFFSFGVFCHLRPEHSRMYLASLYNKMAAGGNCFLMTGDFDKYNALRDRIERCGFQPFAGQDFNFKPVDKSRPLNLTNTAGLGSWYHFGVDEACAYLTQTGFRIIEKDMGVNFRDPVIHFVKP